MDISKLNTKAIQVFFIKALVIWLTLTLLVIFYGDELLKPFMYFFCVIAEIFTDGYSVNMRSGLKGTEEFIIMSFTTLKDITLGDSILIKEGLSVSTYRNDVNMLVPLVILFSLILAWPLKSFKQSIVMVASGLINLLIILLATIPFQGIAWLERHLASSAASNNKDYVFSYIYHWGVICDSGGIWLLSIIGAIVSITFAIWQTNKND